jgi:hypothetical protein
MRKQHLGRRWSPLTRRQSSRQARSALAGVTATHVQRGLR